MQKLKINKSLIIFVAIISILIGAIGGGYIHNVSFNSIASGNKIVIIPMNSNSYTVYGKEISSDINTLQFYVNNKPISLGETIDGVWLAQQKAKSGYFIVTASNIFSTISENSLKPPQNVWVIPASPKTQEVIYLNANGVWDTDTQYNGLVYQLKHNDNLVNYGTTVLRKRSGIYDTAVLGMIGNTDPITNQDTLYHEFHTTLPSGAYNLGIKEYYSNIGSSSFTNDYFSVSTPQVIDNSPPVINDFTASPNEVKGIKNILLNANYHSSTGIKKAEVIWYNNGQYDFVMLSGSLVISSSTLGCGNNNIILKVTGGNGKIDTANINIDKECTVNKVTKHTKPIITINNTNSQNKTITINTTNTTQNKNKINTTNTTVINKNNNNKKGDNSNGLNKLKKYATIKNLEWFIGISFMVFILILSLIYLMIIFDKNKKTRR